ncbi:SURF1 family protein [Amycolatopsis acidiphila]|uniref:SURF1-like protein n=1 Tax=Amycolatopsis acidiphila TaxID=715473 RepID=A0A558A193_9PSEU|nr:SURF1 family cytochrome oxidase biogenesis protein [Amycolatopsis acidiphila]TVT18016.1 SURF1 family protein [Amycolatopsis acidiphila]UIJ61032.1 SURF1 family protein [Amycolatopsis acidiphila]
MRWKFLLRPSWLALVGGVLVFAFACFWLLSPWQFSRNSERVAQNDAVQASMTAEPKPLDSVLAPGVAPNEHTEWTRVTITGTYLPQNEVVARLRTVLGEPAYEVLTPMRTTTGQVVLIDRGYVQPGEHNAVPPYAAPPAGPVEVVARVRQDETDGKHRDAFADASTGGKLQSYDVDSRVVARASGLDIRPGYFQLDQNTPGVLNALPLPQLDSGPFFSYALQWIAFGVMALGGLAYFTIRELKPGGVLAEMGERQKEKKARKRKSVAQILAEDEEDEADAAMGGDEDRTEAPAQRN